MFYLIREYSSVVEHSIAARTVPGSNPGAPYFDTLAEWLRRWTANPLGYARAGSNPAGVVLFIYFDIFVQFLIKVFLFFLFILFIFTFININSLQKIK